MAFPSPRPDPVDVLIVGAGPAGIGMAATLGMLDIDRVQVVDRHGIGASFRRWPKGMRLLTPSFPSNGFGSPDLNAITPDTSPALMAGEHPTGREYADYLDAVARLRQIHVETGVNVTDVAPESRDLLRVRTSSGDRWARSVVWAVGELAYPNTDPFPGAGLGTHTSHIRDWSAFAGDDAVVVGGYESGIEAALALQRLGTDVVVLDRRGAWETTDPDPSRSLSPRTRARLRKAMRSPGIELVAGVEVTGIDLDGDVHVVTTADGQRFASDRPPVLATGYASSTVTLPGRFETDEAGEVTVTEEADESTLVAGLYLSGPTLRHGSLIFCFIYKFRQRFGVVAAGIGKRLGVDLGPLQHLREQGMLIDDLSCCGTACAC